MKELIYVAVKNDKGEINILRPNTRPRASILSVQVDTVWYASAPTNSRILEYAQHMYDVYLQGCTKLPCYNSTKTSRQSKPHTMGTSWHLKPWVKM